jgi:hypothetical protein
MGSPKTPGVGMQSNVVEYPTAVVRCAFTSRPVLSSSRTVATSNYETKTRTRFLFPVTEEGSHNRDSLRFPCCRARLAEYSLSGSSELAQNSDVLGAASLD